MKPDQHELDGQDVHRIIELVLGPGCAPYAGLPTRDAEQYDEVAARIREHLGEGSAYAEAREKGWHEGYDRASQHRAEDLGQSIADLSAEAARLEAHVEKLKQQVATTITQIADHEMARLERAVG